MGKFFKFKKLFKEDFMGFVRLHEFSGQSIAHAILDHLNSLGIDKDKAVAQAYDGAGSMSGALTF